MFVKQQDIITQIKYQLLTDQKLKHIVETQEFKATFNQFINQSNHYVEFNKNFSPVIRTNYLEKLNKKYFKNQTYNVIYRKINQILDHQRTM